MDQNENVLNCTVSIEWKNDQGVQIKRVSHKSATLRLIRDDFRDIYVEVSTKGAPMKLPLKSINVHKKFMNEGKASIVFGETKCTLYLSNAPPGSLLTFLRTIFVKMTGKSNDESNVSLRTKLLSNKSVTYEEISPVTTNDLNKAKGKMSRTTDTTPSPRSRKRKLNETNTQSNAAKKLYIEPSEQLNSEQKRILQACLGGHNVFFTGSAGTGKSYLLRRIISVLAPDVTVATASTGVAACHIGGVTLHSFAGIGTGEGTPERCCQMASKPAVAQNWRRCKHLIIDEVSMLDGNYFGKIEAVARYIRNNEKPFGGIQLILCGDFFQLPPVSRQTKSSDIKFCFQSPVWNRCINLCYELTQVHRQTDTELVSILNSIRVGQVTSDITERLTQTSKHVIERNGILATRLCSQNMDADTINESKLRDLKGDLKSFLAQDSDAVHTKQLDQQTPVPGRLVLKIGAQVMLLKNVNVSNGLVNGARGLVIDFRNNLPLVRFKNNQEYVCKQEKWIVRTVNGTLMTRLQIPLKLAWAFSIHKSQGLTLDCVEMSLARVFEAGQAYVALSRAQSLETLRIFDFNPKQVWANPDVLAFYRKFQQKLKQTELIPLGRNVLKKSNSVNF